MKKQLTIGMILENPFPSDIRVEKEFGALIEEGYNILLLCPQKKGQKKEEEINGLKVQRFSFSTHVYNRALWDTINAIRFFHPIFYYAIKRFIRKNKIDVLHCHDLPLAGTVVKIGKRYNIRTVIDLHENYPEAIKVWFQWKKSPIVKLKNYLFFNYKRWLKHEKFAVRNCDRVIAVVEEMKERIMNDHNVSFEKITVITNTEPRQFKEQPLDSDIYGELKDQFIVTYTGNVGPHRGVDTAIEGMQFLRNNPDIHLYIVGTIKPNIEQQLTELISKFELENNVHLLGYQPFSKFYSFMKMASLNIIPHKSNGHTDNTIPHKLFQCMMTGNPVIVSSCAPLKRTIEEHNAGYVFRAEDPMNFAEIIMKAYNNSDERESFGQNGYMATINGKLNWENTGRKLIEFYKDLS